MLVISNQKMGVLIAELSLCPFSFFMKKVCSECHQEKSVENFSNGKIVNGKITLKYMCKLCFNKIESIRGFKQNNHQQIKNIPGEIWKDIIGYSDKYEISNFGRVKSYPCKYSKDFCKILKHIKGNAGYLYVSLSKNNKIKCWRISRLVGIHFIENTYNKLEVNHIDGNKLNNHFSNLEWNTRKENDDHAVRNGLRKIKRGVEHHMTKLTNRQVVSIYKSVEYWYILAKKYGITNNTIWRIQNGTSWGHVTKNVKKSI